MTQEINEALNMYYIRLVTLNMHNFKVLWSMSLIFYSLYCTCIGSDTLIKFHFPKSFMRYLNDYDY